MYAFEDVPTCKEITEEGATNTRVRLILRCDLSINFSKIVGKNRGCGLYSGATCSPENTVYHLFLVFLSAPYLELYLLL